MGCTEEQGAIVTLQSEEKPAVGWQVTSCSRRLGFGFSEVTHSRPRRRQGRRGQVGACGRSMGMAFPCTAPALRGESTAGTGAASTSSGTQQQLENTWHSAENALCMDLPCAQPRPPNPQGIHGDRPRFGGAQNHPSIPWFSAVPRSAQLAEGDSILRATGSPSVIPGCEGEPRGPCPEGG